MIIAALHQGIQEAVTRHFIWSRGHMLTESGAESIISVCSAGAIYKNFSEEDGIYVNIEVLLDREIFDEDLGQIYSKKRVDVYAKFANNVFFVEAKRFLDWGRIGGDLCRLRDISNLLNIHGFAVKCYLIGLKTWRVGENYDYADKLRNSVLGRFIDTYRLNISIDTLTYSLPEGFVHQHSDRFDSVVIEVHPNQ